MSDVDLRKYISDVVPKSFDFVYLRFDFNSSANVGYGTSQIHLSYLTDTDRGSSVRELHRG
jgi:hypothetical protein